jgi:hypothetical protein
LFEQFGLLGRKSCTDQSFEKGTRGRAARSVIWVKWEIHVTAVAALFQVCKL